tara:strand:- start:15819 stop:17459 length:1641 start_codon:yes stop_codon:yes gene_type:complete
MASPNVTKLFWNAKYDLLMFKKSNVKVRGPIIDVMLVARILHTAERTGTYTLKHFARKLLGYLYTEETKLKKWISMQKRAKLDASYGAAPRRINGPYALLDAKATFELFWMFKSTIESPSVRALLKREHKVLRTTMEMEDRGLLIDNSLTLDLMASCSKEMQRVRGEIADATDSPEFNPNSSQQVAKQFFTIPKRNPVSISPGGLPSTDKVAMLILRDHYEDPLAQTILDWRKVYKARGTYLKKFLEDTDSNGVLRGSFNQSGTRTGRFSSSGPNLQNITRPGKSPSERLRECFIARPGFAFICMDYNQIELRLGAHFSCCKSMLEAISKGEDLHGVTARRMFNVKPTDPDWKTKRQISKTLNFAILYGIGLEEFRNTMIRESEMYFSLLDSSRFIRRYKEVHPEIVAYFDEIKIESTKTGGVTNPYGRFMEVPRHKQYVGVNYKIQSTAADLIKERMTLCRDILKPTMSGLVMICHDELVFEMWRDDMHLLPQLKQTMEELSRFSVPLTVSVSGGERWGKKRELLLEDDINHPCYDGLSILKHGY